MSQYSDISIFHYLNISLAQYSNISITQYLNILDIHYTLLKPCINFEVFTYSVSGTFLMHLHYFTEGVYDEVPDSLQESRCLCTSGRFWIYINLGICEFSSLYLVRKSYFGSANEISVFYTSRLHGVPWTCRLGQRAFFSSHMKYITFGFSIFIRCMKFEFL